MMKTQHNGGWMVSTFAIVIVLIMSVTILAISTRVILSLNRGIYSYSERQAYWNAHSAVSVWESGQQFPATTTYDSENGWDTGEIIIDSTGMKGIGKTGSDSNIVWIVELDEREEQGGGADPGTVFTFTNLDATGRTGPTTTDLYIGTPLEEAVTLNSGIQSWTVPSTGSYTIEVWGAQGGGINGQTPCANGGLGAYMKGDFNLSVEDVINILVGQIGGSTRHGGGGGGGTYVVTSDDNPLIVAGGGGGGNKGSGSSPQCYLGESGLTGTCGGNCKFSLWFRMPHEGDAAPGDGGGDESMGGSNGYGGGGSQGGGGGGFFGNGGNGQEEDMFGFGYLNGGAGGTGIWQQTPNDGGFGGGGGGARQTGYGGGGGGYSGGGGGAYWGNVGSDAFPLRSIRGNGGGGGSYNSGSDQLNLSGEQEGHGMVRITFIGQEAVPDAPAVSDLAVGDYAHGGVVFYIFDDCDPRYVPGEGHGLVCATTDQSTGIPWGSSGTLVGAMAKVIGIGQTNTTLIVASEGPGNYAAQLCDGLEDGGYFDWFLPSKDELNEMYQNKTIINATASDNGGSNFTNSIYWNSTEGGLFRAWGQSFLTGGQGGNFGKGSPNNRVRAVRAF